MFLFPCFCPLLCSDQKGEGFSPLGISFPYFFLLQYFTYRWCSWTVTARKASLLSFKRTIRRFHCELCARSNACISGLLFPLDQSVSACLSSGLTFPLDVSVSASLDSDLTFPLDLFGSASLNLYLTFLFYLSGSASLHSGLTFPLDPSGGASLTEEK